MGPKLKDSTKVGNGTACGDCYGAQQEDGQCCNTCKDVRASLPHQGLLALHLSLLT